MGDHVGLGHVRWIGGGSGAGKTTIARRVSAELGVDVYDTDAAMAAHARRLDVSVAPRLHEFLAMTMDERWVERTPDEMLDSFHWFAGEGFELIVGDLAGLTDRGLTVAEGFRLLPGLVAPLLDDRRDAVWLLPTAEFRRTAFERRRSLPSLADATSDPATAVKNLLERDRLFTARLRTEVAALGLQAIEVDVGDSADDVFESVVDALRLRDGD